MTRPSAGQPGTDRGQHYLMLAEEYAEAACRLCNAVGDRQAICLPFFHIVAHAAELSLKAVLSIQGRDEEELMMIGHSLDGCRRHARLDALNNPATIFLMEALDQPHGWQAFRYPQHGGWSLPTFDEAVRSLAQHLNIVRSYVLHNTATEAKDERNHDRPFSSP
jgi:hypothetical protein